MTKLENLLTWLRTPTCNPKDQNVTVENIAKFIVEVEFALSKAYLECFLKTKIQSALSAQLFIEVSCNWRVYTVYSVQFSQKS